MLADEYPDRGFTGPKPGDPAAVSLMMYVRDVDAVVHGVRQATPWNMRANAALLPGSGLEGIRTWFAGLRR